MAPEIFGSEFGVSSQFVIFNIKSRFLIHSDSGDFDGAYNSTLSSHDAVRQITK